MTDEGAGPHWFEAVADTLGSSYLRYSFTYGTVQEIDVLEEALGLSPGGRVLDVGCGPGRHSHELARRGYEVVGVDVSARFVELARQDAPPGATFVHQRAEAMTYDGEFDAALSLCQGAFGLAGREPGPDPDVALFERIAAAVRPGGRVAASAFSAYFRLRHLDGSEFDAATGVNHEHTEVRDESGAVHPAELWTTCFTPRELRLTARAAGLVVDDVWSVEPGAYGPNPPTVDSPEYLLLAHRPR